MALKRALSQTALRLTPTPLWNAYLRARGLPQVRRGRQFDNIQTVADPTPLVAGRFGATHDEYRTINPHYGPDTYRYRHYNVCYFASLCRDIPGDFVIAGVSFGATAKILYEFLSFPSLGKTLHLVDPFDARNDGRSEVNYNCDADSVRRLFSPSAPVEIHEQAIPIKLFKPLAFVCTDTGENDCDIAAFPSFYEALNPGGIWLSHTYGRDTERYQSAFDRFGVTPLWFPSGQGVIIKR